MTNYAGKLLFEVLKKKKENGIGIKKKRKKMELESKQADFES